MPDFRLRLQACGWHRPQDGQSSAQHRAYQRRSALHAGGCPQQIRAPILAIGRFSKGNAAPAQCAHSHPGTARPHRGSAGNLAADDSAWRSGCLQAVPVQPARVRAGGRHRPHDCRAACQHQRSREYRVCAGIGARKSGHHAFPKAGTGSAHGVPAWADDYHRLARYRQDHRVKGHYRGVQEPTSKRKVRPHGPHGPCQPPHGGKHRRG